MGFIREGVLFCYLLAIFFGIAGITIGVLAGRKHKTPLNRALMAFMLGMLIMSLYDMLIFYTGYIIGDIKGVLVLRVGNCIIAILFYLWINLQQKIAATDDLNKFNRAARVYIIAYSAAWLVSTLVFTINYFYTLRWLLLVTDIILLLIMLVASVSYMSKVLLAHREKIVMYMIIVTAMLVWNYGSYFWGEASVYWGNSRFIRAPLDLTIVFWFVVNIATLIFIYKEDFREAYERGSDTAEFDLLERMNEVAREFDLTSREKDLSRLIYEGKSNSEIAGELFISESTVKTHIYNIFRKLGVKNRMEVACVIRGEKVNGESKED